MRRALTILTACCITWASSAQSADHAASSGEELYRRLCASCHGVEGRGDGPVAASLRVEVPDLTRTASRARGMDPRERIWRDSRSAIRTRSVLHRSSSGGSLTM